MIRKFILAALLLAAPSVWAQGTISAMTAASALSGTELFECVQSGSKKCTATQIKTFTSASPTLVTPNIGTPSAGVLTNATGYTVGALSGAGTGVLTALGVNVGSAGAPVLFNGAGGTPSSLTCTNCTGTASGLTAGTVTTNANLSGDVTSSGNATTLATVNSNVGSFTNSSITVNAKGLVTAASSGAAGAILGANTFTALQTITQASANAGIIASTGYSLTGSDATGMVNLAGTLNTTGNPVALKIALTNTASGATTKFASFLAGAAGATEILSIDKTGAITLVSGGVISSPAGDMISIANINGTSSLIVGNTQGGPATGGGTKVLGALHPTYFADLTVTSGGTYADSQTAGNLYLRGGTNYAGGTNSNGGTIYLYPGSGSGSGATGSVVVGTANSSSPVARTLNIGESARAGTDNNTAGASGTIRPGAGTGTATPASFVIQTYVPVASGTGVQTATAALTLSNALTLGSHIVTPASSGTRYLCIDTGGIVTSSASACSGT